MLRWWWLVLTQRVMCACRCDAVVLGMGVVPATPYLSFDSTIRKAANGAVMVDPFLHAGNDVYVAGDIANFPYWLTGDRVRVEHWNLAMEMGKLAAGNMARAKHQPFLEVPFFSSFVVRGVCILFPLFGGLAFVCGRGVRLFRPRCVDIPVPKCVLTTVLKTTMVVRGGCALRRFCGRVGRDCVRGRCERSQVRRLLHQGQPVRSLCLVALCGLVALGLVWLAFVPMSLRSQRW